MINPQLNNITFIKEEYNLYARHFKLQIVGLAGQRRIKQAKILVVGAGGLGCPAMLYLAIAGIGYIGIIDDDSVNVSNLNRQILYNQSNINKKKSYLQNLN